MNITLQNLLRAIDNMGTVILKPLGKGEGYKVIDKLQLADMNKNTAITASSASFAEKNDLDSASMFYWRIRPDRFLETVMKDIPEVTRVNIASAFLSQEGVSLLRNIKKIHNLSKDKIVLYLSDHFSTNNPDQLLVQLKDICITHIVFSEHLFHPKVYWFESTKEDIVLFGSSNLTAGGMANNVEFDMLMAPTFVQKKTLREFFYDCHTFADKLDDTLIDKYRSIRDELLELERIEKQKKNAFQRIKPNNISSKPEG